MGYRSRIRIQVLKEEYNELQQVIDQYGDYLLPFDYLDENEDEVIFGWDYIKWYDFDEPIKAVEAVIEKFIDEDLPFKFIEIYEDGEQREEENKTEEFTKFLSVSTNFTID